MNTQHLQYPKKETQNVAVFADVLQENAKNSAGTFDSASAFDFVSTVTNQHTGVEMPVELQLVLDECDAEGTKEVTKAILDGIAVYEYQHGAKAPADLIETAIHLAYSTTDHAKRQYGRGSSALVLDSANSNHHDQISLQPNRAALAVLTMMGEAIPFAHYLPADIGSNEVILAIMSHIAGSTHGMYAENAIMDGANSGDSYVSSSRVNVSTPAVSTGNVTGALTKL